MSGTLANVTRAALILWGTSAPANVKLSVKVTDTWSGTPFPSAAVPTVPANGGSVVATVSAFSDAGCTVQTNTLSSASVSFDTTIANPEVRWRAAQAQAVDALLGQLLASLAAIGITNI